MLEMMPTESFFPNTKYSKVRKLPPSDNHQKDAGIRIEPAFMLAWA